MPAAPRAALLQGTLDLLILKSRSTGTMYYPLTKTGRRQLAEETANWNRVALAIGRALET
jgi:hypothetical protein